MELSQKLKDLLLSQRTFDTFGYWPQDLSFGSDRKIVHKCDVCGEEKESIYSRFLKEKTLAHWECCQVKRERTNLKKLGVRHISQCPKIQKKKQQTCLSNHGVEFPWQSPQIRAEQKQTMLERHGVEHAQQNKEIKEQTRQTCIEKYGVDHPKKLDLAKARLRARNQKRWIEDKGIEYVEEDFNTLALQYIQGELQKEDYTLLSTEWKGVKAYIKVQCSNTEKEHIYDVWWNSFQQGHRCPLCRESRGEKAIAEILDDLGIKYKREKRVSKSRQLKLDFYIPSLNVAIEYDGLHHFEPVRFGGMSQKKAEKAFRTQKENDIQKEALCCKKGIRLIRIPCTTEVTQKIIKKAIRT